MTNPTDIAYQAALEAFGAEIAFPFWFEKRIERHSLKAVLAAINICEMKGVNNPAYLHRVIENMTPEKLARYDDNGQYVGEPTKPIEVNDETRERARKVLAGYGQEK